MATYMPLSSLWQYLLFTLYLYSAEHSGLPAWDQVLAEKSITRNQYMFVRWSASYPWNPKGFKFGMQLHLASLQTAELGAGAQ